MLAAIVKLPHLAVGCYDRFVHIIYIVFTYNRNSPLSYFCEVFYHSLHGNSLPNWNFGFAMLDLDDDVLIVVIFN